MRRSMRLIGCLCLFLAWSGYAQIIFSGGGAYSSDGGRECSWCGRVAERLYFGPGNMQGHFCSQKCLSEAANARGGSPQNTRQSAVQSAESIEEMQKAADEGFSEFIESMQQQKKELEEYTERNRKRQIAERAQRDQVALAASSGDSVFPAPIMGFTLGMTLAELEAEAARRNVPVNIQHSPFQIQDLMSWMKSALWEPTGTSPQKYLAERKASFYLTEAFVEGLEAEWVEVCFIEGRLAGAYTLFSDSEFEKQVFDRLCSKYSVLHKDEESAILDMNGFSFLLVKQGCAFFNLPLIKQVVSNMENEAAEKTNQRNRKQQQVLDAL